MTSYLQTDCKVSTNGGPHTESFLWCGNKSTQQYVGHLGHATGYTCSSRCCIAACRYTAIGHKRNCVKFSVAIVFLQLPPAISSNFMLHTTVLFDKLLAAVAGIVNILGLTLGIALFASITLGSWDDMITAWDIKEFEGIFRFPIPITQ